MRPDRIPMLLSASRLALGPCFAAALLAAAEEGERAVAGATPLDFAPLALALVAAATDFADGRLARRLRVASRAGASLDVAADAAFVLCGLAALATAGIVAKALPAAAAVALAAFAVSRATARPADASGLVVAAPAAPRSPADALGHAAGVLNYAIVIAGAAVPLLSGAAGWIRVASLPIAALNLSPLAVRFARSRGAQPSRGSASGDPAPRDRA